MATKPLTDLEVDKIRQWLFGNIDLHGHRVQNAGESVNANDYITKQELIATQTAILTAPFILNPGPVLINLASTDVVTNGVVVADAIQSVSASTNASVGSIAAIGGSAVFIASGKTGSGTYLPMVFETSNTERMRIHASGYVSINGSVDHGYKLEVNGDTNIIGNCFATAFSGSGAALGSLSATNITSGVLAIGRGGTNQSSYTSHGIIYFDGASLQTASNFIWDVSNNRMFIGLSSTDVSGGSIVAADAIQSVTATTNASVGSFAAIAGNYVAFASGKTGSGTYLPLAFFTDGVQAMTVSKAASTATLTSLYLYVNNALRQIDSFNDGTHNVLYW